MSSVSSSQNKRPISRRATLALAPFSTTLFAILAQDYLAALSVLIENHKKAFRALARNLAAKSLLTPAEAATAMPNFSVEIQDQRQDKAQALSLPASFGPRVIIRPYKPETAWFLNQ